MEVEVKICLPAREDYDKLAHALAQSPERIEIQANHFIDGPDLQM
jgi:uncharacterized protein YjbK